VSAQLSTPTHRDETLSRRARRSVLAGAAPRRRRAVLRAVVPMLLLLCCGVSWIQQARQDFQADDAFITYRFAVNWAKGIGPVFNPGEKVEGYSNFLMMAFEALVAALGRDVVSASRALGTLSCWGLIVLVFAVHRAELRRSRSLAIAASGALALHAGLAVFARSGLETVPLACLVLLAQGVFLHERRLRREHWASGLLFGVASLLRADAFLFAGATVLCLLLLRADRRAIASLVIPSLGVFLPWFVWQWIYYGDLLPNTYYVRMGGGIDRQLRGLFYVYKFVGPFGGILLFGLPLVLWVLRDPVRDAARLYLAVSVASVACYVVWVGGDYMPMARFFLPVVPALTLLFLESVHEIVQHAGAGEPLHVRQRNALAAILSLLVVASGLVPALAPRRDPQSHVIETRAQVQQWSLAGRWFRDHVPPDKVLASEPTGAIAFYSGLRIVDMLGVNDAHIAHLDVPGMGRGTGGHEKRDFDYVLSRRPDLIFRGVHALSCPEERVQQGDGSIYRLHSVALGRGPMANRFGENRWTDLFLWYEERESDGEATAARP
jgi:arabinofuranosyltransferase